MKAKNILIVDDIPKNIQLIASFLSPHRYQLAFAQNGMTALQLVKKRKFDLILLDVMMPEMDGFEVCRQLKATEETKTIPVIFLSGQAETESIVKGLEVGAVDYVTKPVKKEELLARVRTHLELKASREQLQKLYAEIDGELKMAAGIQQTIMRESCDVPFLKYALTKQPYGQVCGDMVDFWTDGQHDFQFFIGDATGHGIPAALITMMIPFILDARDKHQDITDVIAHINDSLANRHTEAFITGIYLRLTSDGWLSLCNAGHPAAVLCTETEVYTFPSQGPPMGMFSSDMIPPYSSTMHYLQPGDRLLLFSDGIYEWQNSDSTHFGMERVHAVWSRLAQNRDWELNQINHALMKEVETFAEGNPCPDDITLVAFEYVDQSQGL